MQFSFCGQRLGLLPQKAIYWQDQRSLILSDLHLGKSAHFRKSGIAVPADLVQEDLYGLQQLITIHDPERLIVVGDLFHSEVNQDLHFFKLWRRQFPRLILELVLGNHDIFPQDLYAQMDIRIHTNLLMAPFLFRHELGEIPRNQPGRSEPYPITGHRHPGIRIRGRARQSLCLPCFYFGSQGAILPAFGRFTGMALVQPKNGDLLFAITPKEVLAL